MFKRKKTSKLIQKEVWDLGSTQIPVFIHVGHRTGARAAFGTKGLNIRLPIGIPATEVQKTLAHFKEWAQKEVLKHPTLNERYAHADYADGDTIRVGKFNYQLSVHYSDRERHTGNIEGAIINLKLSNKDGEAGTSKAIKHLLSRLIAAHQLPVITQRVHNLNAQSYGVDIKEVKLKYMSTRWGSCSCSGNINLSTRLLFAPDPVIDYVIIHELAHRLEMNHSAAFWSHVARVMPHYQDQERWLKEFGKQCDF